VSRAIRPQKPKITNDDTRQRVIPACGYGYEQINSSTSKGSFPLEWEHRFSRTSQYSCPWFARMKCPTQHTGSVSGRLGPLCESRTWTPGIESSRIEAWWRPRRRMTTLGFRNMRHRPRRKPVEVHGPSMDPPNPALHRMAPRPPIGNQERQEGAAIG